MSSLSTASLSIVVPSLRPTAGLRLPNRDSKRQIDPAEGIASKRFRNTPSAEGSPIENATALGSVTKKQTLKECLDNYLKPHQLVALERIFDQKKLILADEMGLGKTITTLATILTYLRETHGKKAPFLVICPADLISTWQTEAAKLNKVLAKAGLKHLALQAAVYKSNQKKPLPEEFDLVLVNYETFTSERHRAKLLACPWDGIVCDESHYLKTFKTKRSEAVADACEALQPPFIILLSGTTMENRIDELCGQLRALRPDIFGSHWKTRFDDRVNKCVVEYVQRTLYINSAEDLERQREKIRELIQAALARAPSPPSENSEEEQERISQVTSFAEALAYTRDLIHTYVLHRTKSDLGPSALLAPIYGEILWKMDPWQLKLYEDFHRKFIDSDKKIKQPLMLISKLNQICNHPSLVKELQRVYAIADTKNLEPRETSSGKMDALALKLQEILPVQDNRALIFVHQKETGRLIQDYLHKKLGIGVRFVNGEDSIQERDNKISASIQSESASDRVLIITDGTGSLGRNLAQFNYLFSFDLPWSKKKWDQQVARIYRTGQTRQPYVFSFICENNPFPLNLDRIYREMYVAKQVAVDAPYSRDADALVDLFFAPKAQLLSTMYDGLDSNKSASIAESSLATQKEGAANLIEIYDMLQNDEDLKDLDVECVERERMQSALSGLHAMGSWDPEQDEEKAPSDLHSWEAVEGAVQWFFKDFDSEEEELEESDNASLVLSDL